MTDEISSASEPTSDEKTMATLAHALQVVGGWIAPLVIFLLRRNSRFVSFHALQVLLLELIWMVVAGIMVMVWVVFFFSTIFMAAATHPHSAPPPALFFLFFPLIWGGFMLLWLGKLVIAIVYALKAGRGEWADYPLLGSFARRILKIPRYATISQS